MEKIALKSETVLFMLFCVVLFFVNLCTSSIIELSFDEAYYWMYSENLSFGYFDHPPMVGLMIKAGTLIFGNTELGVRFFANILSILSYYIMWKTLDYKYTKFLIISILSMPLLNFAGVVAIPDTPLLFFTSLFFYQIKKFIVKDNIRNSIVLSIIIACMFYSKYHGLLIVLLTVCGNVKFLKQKSFWITVLATTVLFLPHIYWQYQNEFISFKFHLFGRKEKHFKLGNILDYLGGQIALMGFFNFIIFIVLFYKNKYKDTFKRILIMNSFGFFAFLFLLSFRNQIEANWTVSAGIALILLFASEVSKFQFKKYLYLSILPISLMFTMRISLLNLDYFKNNYSLQNNRINEIVGWRDGRINEIKKICSNNKIVADTYQIAAKVSFYTGQLIPALHINSRESQYSLWKFQDNINENQTICYLTSNKNKPGALRVETNYKDPVYIVKETTLGEQAKAHGLSYEEIIRR
jgi:4-amino-4-deoxy-L-arabinose transferase-like glycosyltransferase